MPVISRAPSLYTAQLTPVVNVPEAMAVPEAYADMFSTVASTKPLSAAVLSAATENAANGIAKTAASKVLAAT